MRKADREGHSADAVADALFCITSTVWFRRREEEQTLNIEKLIEALLETRKEKKLTEFITTADRGCGNFSMVEGLERRGIGFVSIMLKSLLRCHLFVGVSHFISAQQDLREEIETTALDEADSGETERCFG